MDHPSLRPLACAAAFLAGAIPVAIAQQPDFPLPERRPGQWEIRMNTSGQDMVIQACTDRETERMMMRMAVGLEGGPVCERQQISREGAGYRIDSVCTMGAMRVTSRTTVTGDFQTTYNVRIEGTVQGGPGGGQPQQTLTTQTARFVAPACTGGLVPGDMLMPGGIKMNVRNLPGMAPGRRP